MLTEDHMIGSAAFVVAPWRYERLEGDIHWEPVDVSDKLSELILTFYKYAVCRPRKVH